VVIAFDDKDVCVWGNENVIRFVELAFAFPAGAEAE